MTQPVVQAWTGRPALPPAEDALDVGGAVSAVGGWFD